MKNQPRFPLIIFLFLSVSLLLFSTIGHLLAQTLPAQEERLVIKLKIGTFVPGSTTLDLPASLTIPSYSEHTDGDYIVQFNEPIRTEWQEEITILGAEILAYIPDYAYKVRMPPEIAEEIEELSFINWVGIYQPAFKLDPNLKTEGTNLYRVRIEEGASVADTAVALEALGATVINQNGRMIRIGADAGLLDEIAHILDVAWITNFEFFETFNEYGGGVIMGANTAHSSGYDGSTQIVAVADTGFGTGITTTAHADVPPGRITAIQDFTTSDAALCYNVFPDGAQDVDSGHGTHTILSVVSDGGASGEGLGTAPAANLVAQAVEEYIETFALCAGSPDGYYLVGIPDDLTNLFQPAYDVGARIHSNSWGSEVSGDYTADSATTDTFMWNNPDMLITFSAGNAGIDGDSDGVVDDDSLGSPATAKNVLTVGASENDRQGNWDCDTGLIYTTCSAQAGQNSIFTYGAAWPTDFPAAPLSTDASAGNQEQMAAFSSRGPTDDGRLKPDVVAPGTWVLSGYSDMYQQEYDASVNPQNGAWQYDGWGFPLNSQYKYMGGTSMSNPLAAGGAAIVRDFYQIEYSHAASAALTKATLINSAADMLDENNDGADDNDFPIPNIHEGWGRIDLANATDPNREWIDDVVGLNTDGSNQYQYFTCGGGTTSLRASLVWTDSPSTEAAATNLVNDLDLSIAGPDGTFLGNNFSGGWSTTGGTADTLNNVENVYIQNPSDGTWTVSVNGTNVPDGPQPYALVVSTENSTCTPTAVSLSNFSTSPTGPHWLIISLLISGLMIVSTLIIRKKGLFDG